MSSCKKVHALAVGKQHEACTSLVRGPGIAVSSITVSGGNKSLAEAGCGERVFDTPVGHHDALQLLEDLGALLDQITHNAASDAVCMLPQATSGCLHGRAHTLHTLQTCDY